MIEFVLFNFSAPFTIQRLCELLTDPKKHYKRTDKFLRGIEKVTFLHFSSFNHLSCFKNFFLHLQRCHPSLDGVELRPHSQWQK